MITFTYNGRIYKPSNLEKKLKSLGITKDDITIIDNTLSKNEKIRDNYIKEKQNDRTVKYFFWENKIKGWFISKYNDLSDWPWNEDSEKFILLGKSENEETEHDTIKRLWPSVLNILKKDKD